MASPSQRLTTLSAIDFIARLLAKNPADRMTMSESLAHGWLTETSSEASESQQKLGGDSMWAIESFDEDSISGGDDDSQGEWTRPMTTSGTNLASGAGIHSEESFSQPMGNLRLDTLGARAQDSMKFTPLSPDKLDCQSRLDEPIPEERTLPRLPLRLVHKSAHHSPPSPPLTDETHDGTVTKPDVEAVRDRGDAKTSPPSHKRKLVTKQQSLSRCGDMFSSGSLSPPPSDEHDVGPSAHPKMIPEALLTLRTPTSDIDPVIVPPAVPATKTRRAKAVTRDASSAPIAQQPSPRRSTRPRKSSRIS